MDSDKTSPARQIGDLIPRDRVFRPGKKGAWHLKAHQEYGVIWSHCGIRTLVKDCQYPKDPVALRDLCGTCSRRAKEEIGKEVPTDRGDAS